MKLLLIYFIITGLIFLSRFLFGVYIFNYLKRFINENKIIIDELTEEHSLSYSDLILYHFSTTSIKYEDYSDEMNLMLINDAYVEIWVQIVCMLFWMISIPTLLLCLFLIWLFESFEKFSKSILS
jgi:hypothetical protein